MVIPFNMKLMKDTELRYPQRFANMQQRDYGLIFFNEGNKASLESNHAVITDYIGLESSMRDIESFYKSKGINPCIFSSLTPGELDKIQESLQNHGFELELRNDEYFLHDHEGSLRPAADLQIRPIKSLNIDIMETIALEYGGDWTIKVVERHLLHSAYHLLAGFHREELAALASVSIYGGYSRVADIFTREKFRGRGYGGAMIHYLVDYHRRISRNHLYLFSDDPQTNRLIQKGGFTLLPRDFQPWRAKKQL